MAYPTMTISMIDLHSLCAIAKWIVTQRQAEDGHFLEESPVIMASMQVPMAPLLRIVKQKPGFCAMIGEETPALFSSRMKKEKS